MLATKPEKGFTNIISSLSKIDSLNYLIAGRSIVLKTYFDTKYLEFVDVFRNYPDKEIYLKLSKIDKSHKLIYDEAYKRLTKNNYSFYKDYFPIQALPLLLRLFLFQQFQFQLPRREINQ